MAQTQELNVLGSFQIRDAEAHRHDLVMCRRQEPIVTSTSFSSLKAERVLTREAPEESPKRA